MPVLLQISQISKAFGIRKILDNATASFASDQKIGVIGRNGAGKSTLCRIITGHEKADSGNIIRNSDLRLGYIEQHDVFQEGETVADFVMRMSGCEHWEAGMMAARFQIPNEMLDMAVKGLPGGFQTRVKLTAMLLTQPNFLILDEPSNYLDLSTLILLENFLKDFRGGYLIVSHDREFLKHTCDHTLEVEPDGLTLFPGNIEDYFEFKEEQLAQAKAYNRGIEKKRDQLERFVERFRAKASTASRAQAKMKQLNKLETIEIGHEASTVRIKIPQVEAKAGVAIDCRMLEIGYPTKTVAAGIDFDVERGQRVGVLGDNGEGKTTFLKTVAGILPPKSGEYQWGTNLKIAYYAQHVFAVLSPEDNILAYLTRESADGVTQQDILDMAGSFLFKGEDVKKKIKVLSGGERARLVLAGMLLSKSNVLLLDEPTNHLDFETVEALGHALQNFTGTVLFISHDRTFVNMVATSILEVKAGKIIRYPGTYSDYVEHLEMMARGEEPQKTPRKAARSPHSGSNGGEDDESQASEKSERKSKIRSDIAKLRKDLAKAEKKMNNLVAERDRMIEEMKTNPFFHSKERDEKMRDLQIRIEDSEDLWASIQEKLEKLEAKK